MARARNKQKFLFGSSQNRAYGMKRQVYNLYLYIYSYTRLLENVHCGFSESLSMPINCMFVFQHTLLQRTPWSGCLFHENGLPARAAISLLIGLLDMNESRIFQRSHHRQYRFFSLSCQLSGAKQKLPKNHVILKHMTSRLRLRRRLMLNTASLCVVQLMAVNRFV